MIEVVKPMQKLRVINDKNGDVYEVIKISDRR